MNDLVVTPEDEVLAIVKELFPPNCDGQGMAYADPISIRRKILQLEDAIKRAAGVQMQIKTTHRFVNGVYAREVLIPKGALVVGRIHKHPCISIMSHGDKTCVTEDGVIRLKPPYATISKAGVKRVGFAHDDSIWTTIHSTKCTTVEDVEKELFADTYEDVPVGTHTNLTFETMEGFLCQG